MASTYKVLGQSSPAANTATTLYTVPGGVSTVVSTINVCNQSSSSISYRVAVRPAGETLAQKHYIAYDVGLAGNDSVALTLGVTLAATDVITVQSSVATTSFSAFGSEVS